MANYNYVSPLQKGKSYSDMNKERLAAKAVKDTERIKQRSAGDTQRQKYLDQLSGLKTDGWSTAQREEFGVKVDEARQYIRNTPINQVDIGSVTDALLRMQSLGDSHAKLRAGQTEYESYFGKNAKESEDDSWDSETIYDRDGWEKRLNTFNHNGLINYSNGRGDFSNPDYDPNAEAGSKESYRSKRELYESQGLTIERGPDGKDYADVNGQKVPVNGSAFDVEDGGFGNLWNPDKKTRDTITPDNAFLNFKSQGEGASIFTTLANEYATSVKNGQLTQDAAYDKLKGDALGYLTGQDPSLSLRASAIRMWEEEHDMEWSVMEDYLARDAAAQQELENAQEGIQYADVNIETPWNMYAEAIADHASLKPKPSGSGSDKWDAKMDLWMPVQDVNSYMGVDPETSGAVIGDNAIAKAQWDQMLGMNLGGNFGGQVIGAGIQSIKNDIEAATQKALNISIPQAANMEYDEQYIDRVTYHPEDDYIFIWRTDPSFGQKGPLSEDSAWAYTKTGQGEERGLFFQVIYKWKGGKQPTYDSDGKMNNGAEWTQQYRDLRGIFKLRMPEDVSGTADPLQFLFDKAKQI
tara:strand:+ start:157 stop:1896 length:1740 start_codon:yes stop_codon:yes gene_type:complete